MTIGPRLILGLCLYLLSTPLWALDLIRVRSDPTWAVINNNVNVELDFAWSNQRTVALAFYYTDGWGSDSSPRRVFSPGVRIDFNEAGPRSNGWHPNVMLQTDLVDNGDGSYAGALRFKARQSYRWVIDPVSVSTGLGVQARTGTRIDYLDCYLCPTYEISVGWAL